MLKRQLAAGLADKPSSFEIAYEPVWAIGTGVTATTEQAQEAHAYCRGLVAELFTPDGLECYGEISLLKGGLAWADRIITVSPSYAEELQTPQFGVTPGQAAVFYQESRVLGGCWITAARA